MVTIDADSLYGFSRDLLAAYKVPADEAEIVARSLIEANLRGHDSHGVMRIPQYLELLRDGHFVAGAKFEVVSDSPAIVVADGNWGLGQVQAHRLLDRMIPKVQALGMAAGTLRQCGHTGRLGEYAERAAAQGYVFLGTVNSHGAGRRIAPPGGTDGRISTNPICMGAPTSSNPIILDMGTSVVAEGKIRVAYQKGESIPEGWILDAEGKPTTDPSKLYVEPMGTILPLGGSQAYKGFGLGVMLDILAGGLSGGSCCKESANRIGGNAVFFLLLDPARFGGREHFIEEVNQFAAYVRSCPRMPGIDAIQMPGDPELQTHAKRRQSGLPIAPSVWNKLADLAENVGIQTPRPAAS